MAVYVDDANIQASVPNGNRVHTSRWCHLMADTLPELEAFARRLRLSPSWLQVKRSGVHYDLTAGKRRQSVALGAVEVPARNPDGIGLNPEWARVVAAACAQFEEAS